MTSLIDKVLSGTSADYREPSPETPVYNNKDKLVKVDADSDNGIWFWYNSNLKHGRFEEITRNKTKQKTLMLVLERYFKEEIGKKNSQFRLLIISISQQMMDKKSEIENFLLNKFKIRNNEVISLNECKEGDDEENALYLIPIYDCDFHILQAYYRNCSGKDSSGHSDETISQLQSFDSIASVPISDSEYASSEIDDESEPMDIPKIYSSDNSELLTNFQNNNNDNDEYDDDDEKDAIVLNFTRSTIRNRHVTPNNLYHITSDMSESMSVLSIQSEEYDYEGEETDGTDGTTNKELYRLSENADDCLSLQYIYPSLSRVAPKNGSLLDINLRVCHILAKDYGSDIMWHAIRQSQGEDWIIYDSKFSMNNLQYCQLNDILTGRPIDGNESDNENINDNVEKHMMVLFCEVI